MDLQQTVQDLAEAWVAVSTDTSFSRTQLQVYGSGGAQGEGAEEGTEPSTSGEGDFSGSANPMSTPSSPPHGLASGDSLASSHSRKRKQSSPQPRREGSEPASTASPAPTTNKGNPPSSKRVKDSGKMLPVHCIVELLDKPSGSDGEATKEEKKKEGYAIVPSTLQLRDLVRVALSKLDYPPERAKNATGVIQVRNWKALPFCSITDNEQSSVGQLFGDLLSHITLKISVLSSDDDSNTWTDQAVRCTVVELLKDYNQSKLAQICPLSQSMISYIANAKYKASISSEKCEEFGKWYQTFNINRLQSPEQHMETSNHKVTFDPTQEVPLLREWYQDFPHPSEALLHQYCNVLNNLTTRKGRKRPVELMHLKNWWKNERAKHKRNAMVSRSQRAGKEDC
uniref:Compass-like protein n=1 Tax=Paracentrotus lividus TaxID=7656 RepID=U5PYL7_PARLI|nr:compass-like protein [Paracentrotus lividus]